MTITKATVILSSGTDKVYLHIDLPSPFTCATNEKLVLSFDATQRTGAEYVRIHLGIEPEVFDSGCDSMH